MPDPGFLYRDDVLKKDLWDIMAMYFLSNTYRLLENHYLSRYELIRLNVATRVLNRFNLHLPEQPTFADRPPTISATEIYGC